MYLSLSFVFLGPYPQHMEVPRLGVELELQLPAYTIATATPDQSHVCGLNHGSQQRRILNSLSKTRDGTRSLMVPSRIHFCCATMGTPVTPFEIKAECSLEGLLFFFLSFFFLGLHLQHMEVPRLGVELELQLPAYATATWDLSCVCDPHHSLQQCWILNPVSEARDQTCALMDDRFVSAELLRKSLKTFLK